MADPLLTTLCGICHTAAPKYTCPGCRAHTCSLACSQKHKAWAGCTGRRDPTAFMPASRLKTPAGVDHDYNFLSSIERERDRNQRNLVEERGLFSEKQLRDLGRDARWRQMWFGDEVRFVSVDRTAGAGGSAGRPRGLGSDGEDGAGSGGEEAEGGAAVRNRGPSVLARKVRQRLDYANVEVVHMPVGMARQRENITAWNRKTGRINWCVEWILHDSPEAVAAKQTTRIRHKALETTPAYKALGDSLAWYRRGQAKDEQEEDEDEEVLTTAYARKRRRVLVKEVREEGRRSAMQDADNATWLATPYSSQNPYAATWDTDRTPAIISWLPEELTNAKRHHRFYLLNSLTPAGKPKELIPLESTETIGGALMGRTVLEFPTVYVLPPAGEGYPAELPDGFILGSAERRPKKTRTTEKRKAPSGSGSKHPSKRQAVGEGGIPTRGGRYERGGGRGRRGRGGRFQSHGRRNHKQEDAEQGEINSDGDEFHAARAGAGRADTSSSNPDTSSEEEGEFGIEPEDDNSMSLDEEESPEEVKSTPAVSKKTGLGLVCYSSDSGEDSEDEDEGVDISEVKPENPELVANAIQEIVGLLT